MLVLFICVCILSQQQSTNSQTVVTIDTPPPKDCEAMKKKEWNNCTPGKCLPASDGTERKCISTGESVNPKTGEVSYAPCGCVRKSCSEVSPDSAGVCKGVCPQGNECKKIDDSTCQCKEKPCGDTHPSCDGLCYDPSDNKTLDSRQICIRNESDTGCFCIFKDCSEATTPQCDGRCASGNKCTYDKDEEICKCSCGPSGKICNKECEKCVNNACVPKIEDYDCFNSGTQCMVGNCTGAGCFCEDCRCKCKSDADCDKDKARCRGGFCKGATLGNYCEDTDDCQFCEVCNNNMACELFEIERNGVTVKNECTFPDNCPTNTKCREDETLKLCFCNGPCGPLSPPNCKYGDCVLKPSDLFTTCAADKKENASKCVCLMPCDKDADCKQGQGEYCDMEDRVCRPKPTP